MGARTTGFDRTSPHTTGHGHPDIRRPLTGIAAGQGPFVLLAEGKGFEPLRTDWVPP
jgi:hypothetical protein